MFPIDTPSASTTLPAPKPAGAPGHFSDGDPRTGQQATIPGADWFNMMTQEILGVLTAAGIVPDKNNRNQLAAAIAAMIAAGAGETGVPWGAISGSIADQPDLAAALNGKAAAGHTHAFATGDIAGLAAALDPGHLHAENGWAKLPGGTIIQWGRYAGYLSGEGVTPQINYPIAFPNGVGSIICTDINPTGTTLGDAYSEIYSKNLVGFTVFAQGANDNSSNRWNGCEWFAVGW